MIQNLYIDLCTHLDGGGIGKPNKSQPITILTQWRLVGNSEVRDGQIMSCGDLGEDGKYHVRIKADSRVIDIPLDEPLRKVGDVGDVGDTIEFPTDTPNTAKVTRNIGSADLSRLIWMYREGLNGCFQGVLSGKKTGKTNILAQLYSVVDVTTASLLNNMQITGHNSQPYIYAKNILYTDNEAFKKSLFGVEIIYELATPTTSYISVPNIPLAKAYSSANQVPYSEFSYENPNALYIDGDPMTDEDGNEIVMKIGRKTFNID